MLIDKCFVKRSNGFLLCKEVFNLKGLEIINFCILENVIVNVNVWFFYYRVFDEL